MEEEKEWMTEKIEWINKQTTERTENTRDNLYDVEKKKISRWSERLRERKKKLTYLWIKEKTNSTAALSWTFCGPKILHGDRPGTLLITPKNRPTTCSRACSWCKCYTNTQSQPVSMEISPPPPGCPTSKMLGAGKTAATTSDADSACDPPECSFLQDGQASGGQASCQFLSWIPTLSQDFLFFLLNFRTSPLACVPVGSWK